MAEPAQQNATTAVEAFKALVVIPIEAFKYLALVNGGAAVALLTFMGSRAKENCAYPPVGSALAWFVAGLVICGLGLSAFYMFKLSVFDIYKREHIPPADVQAKIKRGAAVWILGAGGMYVLSLATFAMGCWSAVRAL
jgi:hypothetical protein